MIQFLQLTPEICRRMHANNRPRWELACGKVIFTPIIGRSRVRTGHGDSISRETPRCYLGTASINWGDRFGEVVIFPNDDPPEMNG